MVTDRNWLSSGFKMISYVVLVYVMAGLLVTYTNGQTHNQKTDHKYVPVTPSTKKGHTETVVKKEYVEFKPLSSSQCILPKQLGITSITKCSDILQYGILDVDVIDLQSGLEQCIFFDDISCDQNNSDGKKHYRDHLISKGYNDVDFIDNENIGSCLKVEKTADSRYMVANKIKGEVLCCRSVCKEVETVVETEAPVIVTSTTTQEALLSLEDDLPQQMSIITTTTTRAPPTIVENYSMLDVADMCIDPQYLNLPRVTSCSDLRDVALSTSYVTLTSTKLSECEWIYDPTCYPRYPKFGAYLDSNRPDDSCLAMRQNVCDTNILGAFPLMSYQMEAVCPNTKHDKQYAQVVPIPQKKGNHNLRSMVEDEALSTMRSLSSMRALNPSKGAVNNTSDSLLICCRLNCNHTHNNNRRPEPTYNQSDTRVTTPVPSQIYAPPAYAPPAYAPPANDNLSIINQPLPYNNTNNGQNGNIDSIPKMPQSTETEPEKKVLSDKEILQNHLCQPRFANLCSLASPLRGEKIIFDQRCMGSNMLPGCYAGGISPCCRSINQRDI